MANVKKQRPTRTHGIPDLESRINPERLPHHVAIIMDGNGRWARQHGYRSRIQGHRAGVKAVQETVESAVELGLKVLTLYTFSKENWLRPQREINRLMRLLSQYLDKELPRLEKNNIRLVVSGDVNDLPEFVLTKLNHVLETTRKNTRMVLNLCLSYGGRDEIVHACRHICRRIMNDRLTINDISKELFSKMLYHPELGDPDLLIRTSGEFRISNFLLWQIAYTEIYVTPVFWPDFRREDLVKAILDYQSRERRFGKVSEK